MFLTWWDFFCSWKPFTVVKGETIHTDVNAVAWPQLRSRLPKGSCSLREAGWFWYYNYFTKETARSWRGCQKGLKRESRCITFYWITVKPGVRIWVDIEKAFSKAFLFLTLFILLELWKGISFIIWIRNVILMALYSWEADVYHMRVSLGECAGNFWNRFSACWLMRSRTIIYSKKLEQGSQPEGRPKSAITL